MFRFFVLVALMMAVFEVAKCKPTALMQDGPPGDFTPEMAEKVLTDVKKCTGDQLELSDLAGKWQLAYYNWPLEGFSATADISSTADAITGTVHSTDGVEQINLQRPKADVPTFLISAISEKDAPQKFVPVIFLANKRDNYFAMIQVPGEQIQLINWSVFVKDGAEVDKDAVQRITKALNCLGITTKDENAPLLYPVSEQQSD